jgi:hypothetical protein
MIEGNVEADQNVEDLYYMTVLQNFVNKLLKDSMDLSPEISKAVDENFWDLLA